MPIQKISQVKLPNNTVYNLNVYGQYAGGKNLADSITFEGNGDSGKWPLVAYTDDRFHGGKYYMLEVKTVDSSNYIDVGLRMNKTDIQNNFIDGLTYVASFLARVEKTASSNLALRNNTTGIYISSLVKDKVFKNIEYNQDVTIDDFNNRWNIVSVTFQYDASGLSQLQDGPLTIADFRVDGEAVGDKVYVANGRIEMGNIPTTIEIEELNADGFVLKTGDTMTSTLGINAKNNGVGLYVTAGTHNMIVAQALEIGTASKEGVATVDIGNGVATGSADNARGCIRMYDEGTHYHLIKPAGGATVNPTHYLPNSNGFLVTATNTSATGSASKPVYINGDGVATAVDKVAFTAQNSSWVFGRDNAKFAVTTATGYNPAMSIKTKEGSWELSVYASAGQESGWNDLIFSYVTDEKYNAGTNNSQNYRITPAGLYTGYVNLEKVKVNTISNISTNRLMWTGADGTVQAWGNYCDGDMLLVGTADKNTYNPNNAFKLAVNGSTYITQKLSVATSTTFSDTTLFVRGKSRIWGNLHLCEKADSSGGLYFGKLASDSGATYTSVEAFYGQINYNSPCLTASTNTLKDANAGRFTFYQRGFDATTLAPTSYGESYQLPTVTKDRTNSATYNIFTSKNTYTAAEKTAFQTAMGVVNGHTFTYTAASELLTIA